MSDEKIKVTDCNKLDSYKTMMREEMDPIDKEFLLEDYTPKLDEPDREGFCNYINNLSDDVISQVAKRLTKNLKKLFLNFKENTTEKKISTEVKILRLEDEDDKEAESKYNKLLEDTKGTIKKVNI